MHTSRGQQLQKRRTDFEIFNQFHRFQDFTIRKVQRNPTKAGATCEMVYI